MKRLLVITVFIVLVGGASGCRVAECWRYAWNSRFHPERNVIVADPVVMVDPCCDPSGDPCGSGGCGTSACGVPAVMSAPVSP